VKPLLCLFLLGFATARAAEEATPEAITKRQIDAMRELDWAQVAFYTHPKALAQMKALFLPLATAGAAADNEMAAQMMRTLFSGKSPQELEAETPGAFFQTVMQGIAAVVPDFKKSMSGMHADVLGHVNEGELAAHVVYRLTRPAGEGTSTKIAVTTLERDGATWKALLNADLETVSRAITTRLR
jgi:hypothetical protein